MPNWNTILRESGLIVAMAIVIALAFNAFYEKGIPLLRPAPTYVDDSLLFDDEPTGEESAQGNTSLQPKEDVPPESTSLQSVEETPDAPAEKKDLVAESTPTVSTKSEESKEALSLPSAPSSSESSHGSKEVNTSQVKRLVENPNVLFIDARPAHEYAEGKIGNAINIYTPEFDNHIGEVIGLPRDKRIVVYCGGGACELSHELAEKLEIFGFTRVFVYTGGWSEWTAQ